MTLVSTIALVVIALAALIVAVAALPAVLQIRRTAYRVEEFITTAEIELRPALIDLKETLHNVNRTSAEVREAVERLQGSLAAMEELGQAVHFLGRLLRRGVTPRLITASSILKGTRVGLKYLLQSFFREKEEKEEGGDIR